MGHVVHYRNAAGESRLEDVPSLEAALELVERLRNEDGPSDVRVFREVPVEVRTYYKVVAVDSDAAPPTEAEAVADAAPMIETRAVADTPAVRSEPPSGAMPLVAPPVTVHSEMEPDGDADDNGERARRPSLFSRG